MVKTRLPIQYQNNIMEYHEYTVKVPELELQKSHRMLTIQIRERMNIIQKNTHFISFLVKYLKVNLIAPDEIVIEEGSIGKSMYFVTEGLLMCTQMNVIKQKLHQTPKDFANQLR